MRDGTLEPSPSVRPTTEDVVALLDDLRREGFSLGVEQYVLAERVRDAWSREDGAALAALGMQLGPVLCSSAHEQSVFVERFADATRAWRPPEKTAPPARARAVQSPSRLSSGWWWLVTGAMAVVVAAVLLARFVGSPARDTAPSGGPATTAIVATSPTPAAPPVAPSPTVAPTEQRIDGSIEDADRRPVAGAEVTTEGGARTVSGADGSFTLAVRDDASVLALAVEHPDHARCTFTLSAELPARIAIRLPRAPWRFAPELRAGLVLAPLIALACWLGWTRSRRRLVIERLSTRDTIDLTRIPLPPPRDLLFADARTKRAAVELSIHRTIDSPEIDEAATVATMAGNLGLFRPVFRQRRVLPAYLVLYDRRGAIDQQAKLVEELLAAVATPDAVLHRFWFSGDPRLCTSADRARERVDLRELHARHRGQRLILFTDGQGLIDPATGAPVGWLHLLASWEERAILTPVPPAQWGARELLLARAGFHVLPATVDGLQALAALLRDPSEATPAAARWSAPYPSLVATRPARWLERNPPPADERAELVRQLRTYLDADAFRWLCACAVYPLLSWYLTLFLGLQLRRDDGAAVVDEERLLRLVRLPWLRHGSMPDWLRVTLLACLSDDDEAVIRDALSALLLRELRGSSSPFVLEFGARDARAARRATAARWRELRELLRYRTRPGPLQDYVFVTFLQGRRPDRLQLVAPNALQRVVYRRGSAALGVRPSVATALALGASGAAWVVGGVLLGPPDPTACELRTTPRPSEAPRAQPTPSAAPAPSSATGTPDTGASPSPTPAQTVAPSARATSRTSPQPSTTTGTAPPPNRAPITADLLARARFAPATVAPLAYGKAQSFAVELPPGMKADQVTITWSLDGRDVAKGARYKLTADRPDLVRRDPLTVQARIAADTGAPVTHTWSVAVRPPAPVITGTSPPAGIDIPRARPRFEVTARPPVGAQQLTYVFEVDGREAARSARPSFELGGGASTVTAYVVDDYGQRSSPVTWGTPPTASPSPAPAATPTAASRTNAPTPPGDLRGVVESWLARFQAALDAKDADTIGAVLGLDPAKLERLRTALDDQTDLRVRFSDVSITEDAPGEATVRYQRTDSFVDRRTGRSVTVGPEMRGHRLRIENGRVIAVEPLR